MAAEDRGSQTGHHGKLKECHRMCLAASPALPGTPTLNHASTPVIQDGSIQEDWTMLPSLQQGSTTTAGLGAIALG